MDNDIKKGDIVLSKAGRDEGKYFVVLRKVDTPKKKKFRHLLFSGENSAFAIEKMNNGEKLTNTEIRREIREFRDRNNI